MGSGTDLRTAMELNNDYFAIERHQDGRNFTMIGKLEAVGNSNVQQDYSFTDRQPLIGMNYYRIVQVDVDGKRSNTTTRNLLFNCDNGQVKVHPTITRGTVQVVMPTGYKQARIRVFGMNGQQVPATITNSGLFRTVRLVVIAAGTYLVRIENNGTIETFKILYQP